MRIPTLLFFVFLICQQSFAETKENLVVSVPSVSIYYITPVCQSSPIQQFPMIIGSGNYTGGIYSSTSGLVVDSITGGIDPSVSTPGTYVVMYTIPANGGDPSVSAMATITINAAPDLIPPTPIVTCDNDGDGVAAFNLDALIPTMVNGAPNTVITFHETATDAQNGNNPLTSPYFNIVPSFQTLYVRVINTVTGCTSFTTLQLIINQSPVIPAAALQDFTKCDADSNNQNGFTTFNLAVAQTLAQQSNPNYSASLYSSQANASAGTSPIVNLSNFTNTTNPQTIWIRLEDNATGCGSIGTFQLMVSTPLALTTPSALSLCDDGPQTPLQTRVFDLTVKNNEITQNLPGYAVTYYPSYADALGGTNAISAPTTYINLFNAQTIGVKVTAPSGCSSYTTLDIRVLPLPTPNSNPAQLVTCDDFNNGTELFDLTQNESYIGNGGPYAFEYYMSQADALAQSNSIATPTAYIMGTGIVWIRVMNNQLDYSGTGCYVLVQQSVTVNPVQVVHNPIYRICDPASFQTATFTLSDMNDDLVAMTDISNFTITYHMTSAAAQNGTNLLPNSYTNVSNPQNIYARVVNNMTGCVNATGVVTLQVASGATATAPPALYTCDNDFTTPNGVYTYDLTQLNLEVLGGQDPSLFTVAYFSSQADAVMGINQIANPNAYTTASATIWITVTNEVTLCRSDITSISITVYPLPEPVITSSTGENTICVEWGSNVLLSGLTLNSGIPNPDYTFQWYLNGAPIPEGTNTTFDVMMPGVYEVMATSPEGCSFTSYEFTVIKSGPPIPMNPVYIIGNQDITVHIAGYGVYHYQLDDGPIVDNGGVFENLSAGMHTIFVYDVAGGCGTLGIGFEILPAVEDLTFSPNPVINALNISFTEKIQTVTLYNTLGLEVYKQNFNDFSSQIEISSLGSGTYFVKIESANKQKIFKIIKG